MESKINENEFGVELLYPHKLFKHQTEAIHAIKHRFDNVYRGARGLIVALAPGLAKTLTTLVTIMSDNSNGMNLVIAPKTVVNEWKNDIHKFFGNKIPYLFFHKDNIDNFDEFSWEKMKKYKIIITTYETVMNSDKKYQITNSKEITPTRPTIDLENVKGGLLLYRIPWNIIAFDESHTFSNPKSLRYYSMMGLYGEKKILLSGTPLNNDILDIYSQLRVLGYNTITFAKHFNIQEYKIQNLISLIYYRTYEDVEITLPTLHKKDIRFSLQGFEKEIYDYYHSKTRKIYNMCLVGIVEYLKVFNIFQRLRQICIIPYIILPCSSRKENFEESEVSFNIYNDLPEHLKVWVNDKYGTAGIQSTKMREMIKIIKNNVEINEKTIVFSDSTRAIDIATLALETYLANVKYRVIDGEVNINKRNEYIDEFRNDSSIKVLFSGSKVGNMGLNITQANHIIHLSNWWNPNVSEQANHRCHRTGQKKEVYVYNLITKDTIEEKIEMICKEKLEKIDDCLKGDEKLNKKIDKKMMGRILRTEVKPFSLLSLKK